jgi:MscS family membrane protein
MLLDHPEVSPDWLHVRFHSFGAYSLDIAIFAYIRTPEWLKYRAIREDINLKIMDIVKEAGTGFAFPSQMAYLGRDSGLDAERGRQVVAEVQEWRANGQNEGILDYPPGGSAGYERDTGSSAPMPAEAKPTGRQRVSGVKRR